MTEKEESLFSAYFNAASKKDYDQAFEKIEEIKKEYPLLNKDGFWDVTRIRLYMEMADLDNALKNTNIALMTFPENSDLYEIKSDIIYQSSISLTEIDKIINGIESAIHFINEALQKSDNFKYSILRKKGKKPDPEWFDLIQEKKVGLISKRAEMSATLKAFLNRKHTELLRSDIENKIKIFENEKIKQFEQLGLFSAIIALIITNVQIVPKLSIEKLFVFNISFVLAIIFIISSAILLLEIGEDKSFLSRWKFWFIVSLFLISVIFYLLVR